MTSSTRRAPGSAQWLIPTGLLLLTFVPVLAGALRIASLTTGAEVTPESERFFDTPVPVAVHIVGAVGFCVVGAFQFHPGFRRRRPGWHRGAGRVLIICGLAAALSGMWMALFYPRPEGDGDLLVALRLLFGSVMAGSIVLAFAAIRQRDVARHRAWMMRGYAVAQGAGTQALLFGLWALVFAAPLGQPGELPGRSSTASPGRSTSRSPSG